MLTLQLPELSFKIPEHSGLSDIHMFKSLADDFKKLGEGNTPKARWFHKRRQEIMDDLANGVKMKHVIVNSRDIRVLIHLWSTDHSFFSTYPISKSYLKQISRIKQNLTPSQIYSLIRLYFYQFDQIKDLKYFCKFIKEHLNHICSKRRLSKDITAYCEKKDILFEYGLNSFWNQFNHQELNLKQYFERCHIPWDHKSFFAIASKKHLYINPVHQLKPGDLDPVFDILITQDIIHMPFNDEFSIGQSVAMLMMDKASKNTMPDNWRHLIIQMLGDPRIPKSSDQYQKGWAGIPVIYEQQMRKWLSQMDLVVFLEILEEVGKQTGNDMIRRMFPSRKIFLEGIHQTGMIVNTRLFLSSDAIEYMNNRYDAKEQPLFAQINHKNKSLIHIQIGKVHLIEGTHNYSARLLDRLPKEHPITDGQKKKYMLTELTTGIDQAYMSEFKDNTHLYIVPHDIHNAWQRKLIDVFKTFDIHVDI
jgi:hypothetical protein